MTKHTKKDLRERILALLRNQEEKERIEKSLSIKDKLFQMQDIQNAETILLYASFNGEVDTAEMIKYALQLGKRVALPRTDIKNKRIIPTLWQNNTPLEKGPYGIDQPQDISENRLEQEELDAVVVPGLAFDHDNHRLGRGGGFYDRFLVRLPERIPTFGLAFDFQRIEKIPQRLDHDISVTHVVTN